MAPQKMQRWNNGYLQEGLPTSKKYGVAFPEIQLREMVSRWGSCSPKKGFVTFNTALIAMPVSCIEYVVTHEFTHFLYPNHSKKFYQQLATFMPDWEDRKKRLEGWEIPVNNTLYCALFSATQRAVCLAWPWPSSDKRLYLVSNSVRLKQGVENGLP